MTSPEIRMDISDDNAEAQKDTEMQSEDQPIYLTACDCSELFDKCLDSSSNPPQQFLSSEVARFVQEYYSRFNAWVSFLGVFAGEKACLDHRLRHHPVLQDMVIRLLDILRRNLFLVSVYNDEESAVVAKGPSNTIGTAGERVMGDALPPALDVAFSGIEKSITRLNKLGIAIRLSSRSTVVARARNFASQNPKLIRLKEFEDRAYLALQNLYPNASEILRQQLADAMTDRYAKLQYEFYRTRTQGSSELSANALSSKPIGHEQSIPGPPTTEFTSKQDTSGPTEEKQGITDNFRNFPQSSIDTSRLHANLEPEETMALGTAPKLKPPKTLTVHTNRQREPPCPKFKNDENYNHCDWCFQIIDRSVIHIKQGDYTMWSDEGRRHYRNDLQPYVCIAEGCSKSRPTYSSSRDWFNHMISIHSEYWSQNIHSQSLYTCPVEHENNSAYIFSTRDELYGHILLQHEPTAVLKLDEDTQNVAKQYGVEDLCLTSSCPLCLFPLEADPSQDNESDDTISPTDTSKAKKKRLGLHRRSVKRAKLSSSSSPVEVNKVATSWAMGSHIAGHLHYLMIVSLQLMSAMDGASYGEGDTSDSDSPSSRISALDDGPLKNRLDDLPSELQGSIAWSEPLPVENQEAALGAGAEEYPGRGRGDHYSDLDSSLSSEIVAPDRGEFDKKIAEIRNEGPARNDFKIAIICERPLEARIVNELFDKRYDEEAYNKAQGDPNAYSLGVIGHHNVVLVYIPGWGKVSTMAAATSLRASFEEIQLTLAVGICGGVPFEPQSKEAILLGDVIISEGIVQYDLWKRYPDNKFTQKDTRDNLLRPSPKTRAALAELKTQQGRDWLQNKTSKYLGVLQPKLGGAVIYPGSAEDRLFESTYEHKHREQKCVVCANDDGSRDVCIEAINTSCEQLKCHEQQLVSRNRLSQPLSPTIHFGLIGSSDIVMKSGEFRDYIASRDGLIAFETGASGTWGFFPSSLTIRGVCDYADSHRNKGWQGYAAAAAAAATKAFLENLSTDTSRTLSLHTRVELSPHTRVELSPHTGVEIYFQTRFGEVELEEDRTRRAKEIEVLKMLYNPFPDQKDRNPDRMPGTCEWFVAHRLFRDWQETESAKLLWVSADPGCGKSVLTKYLVDSVLTTTESRTTCYFFFKDDSENQGSIISALCCILFQLFTQKPILLSKMILEQIEITGKEFARSFDQLWDALLSAASGEDAGEIICVLDAIDECEHHGRSQLAQALYKLYSTRRNFKLKFLLTSRPYGRIRKDFHLLQIPGLPVIHLRGEGDVEMQQISLEINIFIEARVRQIGESLMFSHEEQHILLQGLRRIPNRTYLWVHRILDSIEWNSIVDDRIRTISNIPTSINEAYEKILWKSLNIEEAKRLLHIIIAAARPLTLKEMGSALALKDNTQSYIDLELQPEERLGERIRDLCGLVTIIDSRVCLLHPSVEEFLIQNGLVPIQNDPANPIKDNLK
ncbi:hypothetical protein TWF481_010610 [Arthrobotrys musiformis]|uniref:NACHT domain-containing protein n=1 Tax=Arthrobotrys musiformis TaxID=47236 RepID=A0AAV9W2D0_9PEZI